jgi:hypothetical protein
VRVLVCGGRTFYNKVLFKKTLDEIHAKTPITCIIQGEASGADFLAKHWAKAVACIPHEDFKAFWNEQGPAAGPIRNKIMLDIGKPDLVVAFPGQDGTADMVKQARSAGVKVMLIKDPTYVPPEKPVKAKKRKR